MQIIGKHFDEAAILRTAYTFEKITDFTIRTGDRNVRNPDDVMIGL